MVPTQLVATPNPVKNGAELTISGKDMDLSTGIAFPNAKESKLNKVETTKVTSTVPEDAQEGDITLSLDNGKTVTVAYTLVKPTVTACTPATITAGERTIIKGTDLDLVKSVTFPGDVEQTVTDFKGTANNIAVTVPTACAGSGFKLNLKNGTTIEVKKDMLTIKAATDPALSQPVYSGMIGTEATIEGKNFNNAESVYIGEVKVTKFKDRTNTSLTFTVPANLTAGEWDLIMVGPDGTKYTVGKFNALPQEVTLWTGKVGPSNWTGDKQITLTDAIKAELKAGKTLGFDIERDATQTYWQVEVCGSWWTGLPCFQKAYAGGERAIIDVAGYDQISATLEQADIDILTKEGGLLFVGNGVYVTRVFVK